MTRLFNRTLLGFIVGALLGFVLYPIIGAWVYPLCLLVGIWIGGANL